MQAITSPAAPAPTADDTGARVELARGEAVFIVVSVLLYWTDLLKLLFPGAIGDTSVVFRVTHFVFYGAFLALVMRRPRATLAGLARAPALLMLLALPLASTAWSMNPQETVQRAVAVLGSSLFGVYLASEIERGAALRLIATGASIAALVSVLLIAAFPSLGIAQDTVHAGAWIGAYGHKNGLGLMSSLGAFICLLVVMDRGILASPFLAGGLVMNVAILLGSRSLTGQIAFALSVAGIFLIGRLVRFIGRHAGLLAIGTGFVVSVAAASLTGDTAVQAVEGLGRDFTFSNRVPIWQAVWPFVELQPWLGYGYEAFWHDTNYAVRVIEGALHFRPWYAHNGFLELLLAFGAMGLGVFALVFAQFMRLAARLLHRDDRDTVFLLAFVFGILLLAQNVSESTILLRNSMVWSLFVMLYLDLARADANVAATPNNAGAEPRERRDIEVRRHISVA